MTISTQFEATDGAMVLTDAILLYQSGTRNGRGPTFASLHAVEHDQGQPTIAAGAPLSRAHLRQWTEALGRNQGPELLPDNVLVSHPDMLAWWVPAKMRASYFALTSPPKGLKALAGRTIIQLPYPAHLFVATRRYLGVYALPADARPTADTAVLHSPVLNVFIEGSLCWGNIPVPKGLTAASIPEYEQAVFDSWSTHPNPGQEHTVTGKGGLVRLWDDLAAGEADRFPTQRLKPFTARPGTATPGPPMTLGALIKRGARS